MVALFLLPAFSFGSTKADSSSDESAILIQQDPSAPEVRGFETPLEKTPVEIQIPLENFESADETTLTEKEKIASGSFYLRLVRGIRNKLPEKLGLVLSKIGATENLKNQVVADLSRRIDKAPRLIENSNATGARVQGYVVFGLGVSEYMMKALKSSRYSKWLPEKVRFGLALGAGFTVLRVRDKKGSKIILRLHSDVEKINRVFSVLAEGFIGLNGNLVSENIGEKVRLFEKARYEGLSLGGMGKMIISQKQFEYGHALGLPLTPIISAAYIYETKGTQYQINLQLSTAWIHKIKESTKSFCRFFVM